MQFNKTEDTYEYAGFWIRVGAALIDTLLLVLLTAPIFFLLYGSIFPAPNSVSNPMIDAVVNWVVPAVVAIIFWISKSSTPGKMVLGMTILDADTGDNLTPGQAVIRYIGYFVSMAPLMLGIMWVGWDSKKQGFHDKIANTVVVKNKLRVQPVQFRN